MVSKALENQRFTRSVYGLLSKSVSIHGLAREVLAADWGNNTSSENVSTLRRDLKDRGPHVAPHLAAHISESSLKPIQMRIAATRIILLSYGGIERIGNGKHPASRFPDRYHKVCFAIKIYTFSPSQVSHRRLYLVAAHGSRI